MQSEGTKEENMPKRKMKRKVRRKARGRNDQNDSFSLFGLAAAFAVIAAGFAYAYGYFPESFNLANFELPNMNLPEVPHSTEPTQSN
jgi:hypothetical protein